MKQYRRSFTRALRLMMLTFWCRILTLRAKFFPKKAKGLPAPEQDFTDIAGELNIPERGRSPLLTEASMEDRFPKLFSAMKATEAMWIRSNQAAADMLNRVPEELQRVQDLQTAMGHADIQAHKFHKKWILDRWNELPSLEYGLAQHRAKTLWNNWVEELQLDPADLDPHEDTPFLNRQIIWMKKRRDRSIAEQERILRRKIEIAMEARLRSSSGPGLRKLVPSFSRWFGATKHQAA
jgi:hypothetical protein